MINLREKIKYKIVCRKLNKLKAKKKLNLKEYMKLNSLYLKKISYELVNEKWLTMEEK